MKKIYISSMLIVLFNVSIVNAQFFPESNDESLQDVSEFDAKVSLATWLDVETDYERFKSNLQNAFELGLLRDGVGISRHAPNYLICEIRAAQTRGIIMYTIDVEYYLYNPDGMHILMWRDGGISTTGMNNFNPDSVAKDCVDIFSSTWLKVNPI